MNSYNPFSLEGKTILITGASSGIGKTTAIECSKMGAMVIVTGRDQARLQETFSLLHKNDNNKIIVADLANEDDIELLITELPMLDGVVFNAGMSVGSKPVLFYKKNDIEKMMLTNTISNSILLKLLVKKKKISNPSSIVFTSSIEGNYVTSIGNGIYGMTKAALSAYSKSAALELAPKGIRCNTVLPGMVKTPLTAPTGAITQEQLDADAAKYPLRRYGEPQDIAYAIIYLLSDASSWVTGSELKIDGGITLV